MQLIWVSGPTAQVVTWSITRRKVLVVLGLMAGFFVLLGGLFQLVGLRVAIEHAPSLAFRMGGIASLQEQQRVEAHYGAQLGQLQQRAVETARCAQSDPRGHTVEYQIQLPCQQTRQTRTNIGMGLCQCLHP